MVPEMGALVVLVALNDGTSPVPAAPIPMAVLLLVQLYTMLPPVVGEVKLTAVVGAPSHTRWLAMGLTTATGFTVRLKLAGVPVHEIPPLVNVGVTVMVATMGAFVLFVGLNDEILPVPEAVRPMAVLLLVQL